MARISGLASDHHPVGPGDAPRRKRGRKNTPSVDMSQGSKRPASPTPVQASTPKRKRLHQDDHDVEEPESRLSSPESSTIYQKTTTVRVRRASDPIVGSAAAAVAGAEQDADEEEHDSQNTPPASTAPLPGLTPHLQRIGASRGRPTNATRRARMSMPAHMHLDRVDEQHGSQIQYAPFKATLDSRTRRRLKRNHLAEEYNEIEEHQKEDKKVRKALIELRRELRERDKTIKDLEFQLESGRLGNIDMTDDETEELRQQLSQAKQEIDELRASALYQGQSRETSAFETSMDGIYEDDDEPMLAIDPNDPEGPEEDVQVDPLPTGEYATRALALSSQVTVSSLRTMTQTTHDVLADASQSDPSSLPDKISDKAVKRYEAEIERLIENLGEAQGALRVVAIELQNLHIVQPGASTEDIVTKLRHGFESVREQLENLLPGTTIGLTNGELLHKIPELFEGVLTELHEQTTTAQTYRRDARVMRTQFENALDILGRTDSHNTHLENEVQDLERTNENKSQTILDLEERVTTLDTLVTGQEADIKHKDAQIHGLRDEVEVKEADAARLRDSIDMYRRDLETVTKTTMRLEDEHRETLAEMEQKYDADVGVLQAQLQDEHEGRLHAEGEAEQKSEFIDQLQSNIELIENQIDEMSEEILRLRDRLTSETQEHADTKDSLEEQQTMAYQHANTIENLEEELEQLKGDLDAANQDLESERTQREQTEASLEEANQEITDLNARLHDAGIQANELRSKLFQVQQEKEEAVAQLKDIAKEREAHLQDALDVETQARSDAEQVVADLEARVAQLENDISIQEADIMRLAEDRNNLEKDRDEHVAVLSNQLADLQKKFTALENSSNSTITTLQANITDLNNEVNAHKAELARVTQEATETELGLKEELDQKDVEMAALREDLEATRDDYAKLEKEHKDSIENFSEESNQFFKVQAKFHRDRTALEQKTKDLQDQIQRMEDEAAQRLVDHETVIAEKSTEIEELHILGDTRAETIVELQAQIEELKAAFAANEQDNRETIDRLTISQRNLQEQNESLAAALKKRNADTLQAVRDMKVQGVQIKGKAVDLHKVSNGKISKISERIKVGKKGRKVKDRSWRDSGFGIDSDIENADLDSVGAEALVG